MFILTEDDISLEALRAEESRLIDQTNKIEHIKERLSLLQAELSAALEEQSNITNRLQWGRLMAEVERQESISVVSSGMAVAVKEFYDSLTAPADYDEAAEGIPFVDTDDYADLSPVDIFVDDRLEAIKELLGEAGPERDGAEKRRSAMLMLLVLTVNIGKLKGELSLMTEVDVGREMEEIEENVTVLWQQLLSQETVLAQAEVEEWRYVLRTFVGAPYDAEA